MDGEGGDREDGVDGEGEEEEDGEGKEGVDGVGGVDGVEVEGVNEDEVGTGVCRGLMRWKGRVDCLLGRD